MYILDDSTFGLDFGGTLRADLVEVVGTFGVEKVEDMVGVDRVKVMVGMRTLVIDMVVVGVFRVDTVVEGIL